MIRGILAMVCLLFYYGGNAQIIIQNSSFEGPVPGGCPPLWTTWWGTPDTRPGGCHTLAPYDGNSYLGVGYGGGGSEAVGQLLSSPIIKGKVYKFSVALSKTNSLVPFCGGIDPGPVEFQLVGVNALYGASTLLWKSDTINHIGWVVYNGMFMADSNYTYIKVQCKYLTPVIQTVYILIDKLSDLEEVQPSINFTNVSSGDILPCSHVLLGSIIGVPDTLDLYSTYLKRTTIVFHTGNTWKSIGFVYPPSCSHITDTLIVYGYYPSDTISETIVVEINCGTEDCMVPKIPNLVTANRDGKNDFLEILDLPESHRLQIYNRWGHEVFESRSYKQDWQGEEGVYYYLLTLEERTFKGWIQVIK
jgi:hypothetical protein